MRSDTPDGGPLVRPNLWFMYDCHQFTKIDTENRAEATAKIRACFDEDPSGLLSMRWPDGTTGDPRPRNPIPLRLHLMADHDKNGWKVLNSEIKKFMDDFYAITPQLPCRRANGR